MLLVKWSEVIKPKSVEGRGLGCLELQIGALLAMVGEVYGGDRSFMEENYCFQVGEDEWGQVPRIDPRHQVLGLKGNFLSFRVESNGRAGF